MANEDYIDVRFDIFEHVGQRASVRKTLTVNALIEEILKEFDDIIADSPDKYAIYLKGAERQLDTAQTLAELDIQPQDELVFDRLHKSIRQMLAPEEYAFLQEEKSGKTYDIQWQPAIIGRPSTDMDHNIILAVNVQLLPEGKTISRRHAQITTAEGRYYIEALADQNPVFINGKEIAFGKRQEIKNGDKLMFGHHRVAMLFKTQTPIRASRPFSTPRPGGAAAAAPEPLVTILDKPPAAQETAQPHTPVNPILVIETASDPSAQGQRISISNYPFTLGRNHPLLKNENEVSRQHAEITCDARSQKFFITDLQSTNGVTIERKRIAPNIPSEIKPGCRIGMGNTLILRFEVK
jgi:pSer/pThr/pTyr-binding forkhead associated (FHA) protein